MAPDIRHPAARRRGLRWEAVIATPWHLFDGGTERGGIRYLVIGTAWTRRRAVDLARWFIDTTTKGA